MISEFQTLWDAFAAALLCTGGLALICTVVSLPTALLVAVGIRSNNILAKGYIDLSIKLPLIVKLFACFYLLGINPLVCAAIALVSHQTAFLAEILRGGLDAVPSEVDDAAVTSGLPPFVRFFRIQLPIALRLVFPALVLQAAEIVKNTSVASLIGVVELTSAAESLQMQTFNYNEGFFAAAGGYLLLILPLMYSGYFLEKQLARDRR